MLSDLLFSEKMSYQLGRNFIIGGILISSVSYIATFMSPMLAALWWACPFTILPTLYFMKKNNVSNEKVSFFLKRSIVALVVLIGIIWLMHHYLSRKMSFVEVCCITTLWWLFFSLVVYVALKNVL
jgi:uncharacterized membrane protein YbhN (UPF0104 family)